MLGELKSVTLGFMKFMLTGFISLLAFLIVCIGESTRREQHLCDCLVSFLKT